MRSNKNIAAIVVTFTIVSIAGLAVLRTLQKKKVEDGYLDYLKETSYSEYSEDNASNDIQESLATQENSDNVTNIPSEEDIVYIPEWTPSLSIDPIDIDETDETITPIDDVSSLVDKDEFYYNPEIGHFRVSDSGNIYRIHQDYIFNDVTDLISRVSDCDGEYLAEYMITETEMKPEDMPDAWKERFIFNLEDDELIPRLYDAVLRYFGAGASIQWTEELGYLGVKNYPINYVFRVNDEYVEAIATWEGHIVLVKLKFEVKY